MQTNFLIFAADQHFGKAVAAALRTPKLKVHLRELIMFSDEVEPGEPILLGSVAELNTKAAARVLKVFPEARGVVVATDAAGKYTDTPEAIAAKMRGPVAVPDAPPADVAK